MCNCARIILRWWLRDDPVQQCTATLNNRRPECCRSPVYTPSSSCSVTAIILCRRYLHLRRPTAAAVPRPVDAAAAATARRLRRSRPPRQWYEDTTRVGTAIGCVTARGGGWWWEGSIGGAQKPDLCSAIAPSPCGPAVGRGSAVSPCGCRPSDRRLQNIQYNLCAPPMTRLYVTY